MKNNPPVSISNDLYEVIPLKPLRKTPGVSFDIVEPELVKAISAIDRVVHANGAISPGAVGEVTRPWYMHPYQEDHLMVLHGKRTVDLYSLRAGRIETLVTTSEGLWKNEIQIFEGPHLLKWTTGVFHRIESDAMTGSASINLATHLPGFDIRTNFNIYDLDTNSGNYTLLREGFLDQSPVGNAL